MNSSDQIQAQQDDLATLTEASRKVEELRAWAAKELDRSMIGSGANDALESLHNELENRRASLNAALCELEDELGAMDDGQLEQRRDFYANLGIGRSAA